MRCILKTVNGNYQQYFIKIQENSIVGWFSGNWMKKQLAIPDNQPLDVHFTFPKDGNFHQSVKLKYENLEQFVSVYWNTVKIKTIVINGDTRERKIVEKTREEFGNNLLSFSVPLYKPDPLDTIQVFFFSTVAVNIFEGSFKIHDWDLLVSEQDLKEDDLVIDVRDLDNVNVNIDAAIRPKDEVIIRTKPFQYHFKSFELNKDSGLFLRCFISPLHEV
jgi:hypothetical protein